MFTDAGFHHAPCWRRRRRRQICIGSTIRMGRESWCPPYAWFFSFFYFLLQYYYIVNLIESLQFSQIVFKCKFVSWSIYNTLCILSTNNFHIWKWKIYYLVRDLPKTTHSGFSETIQGFTYILKFRFGFSGRTFLNYSMKQKVKHVEAYVLIEHF